MRSLWKSFTGAADVAHLRAAVRDFLDGSLTPGRVDDTIAVALDLAGRARHGGELILSWRDQTLLIEVLDRGPAPAHPPVAHRSALVEQHSRAWGSNAVGGGHVVWAEIARDDTPSGRR